jgi:hypothetical protein
VRCQPNDGNGDHDAQGRQERRWCDRSPDPIPRRRQPAFGQDEDQGAVAKDLGQLVGVEVDTEPCFTDRHPDAEIQQQGGQPGAYGETNRCHREQQHQGPDQKGKVEVGDGEGGEGFDVS